MNLPTRGIGARTLEVLRAHAARRTLSRCGSRPQSLRRGARRARPRPACRRSSTLIEKLDADTRGPAAARAGRPRDPGERPASSHYQKDKADKGEARAREPRGTRERRARLRAARTADMPPLDAVPRRTPCSSPARARPRPGRTACR
ncbi:MAG: hypothetical protein MZV65_21400 [Chromatiales bacterium]|nr:hypothetical protein [Chromatiales bacterium]